MLRFLHAGDLHFCSPLASFSRGAAAERRERQMLAFERMLQRGVEMGAQLLLLSGDVFDTPAPDPVTVSRFFGVLSALPIPVVIAPGNHDYYDPRGFWAKRTLPRNVFVFQSATLSCCLLESLGVAIFGYAFVGDTQDAVDIGHGETLREGYINILLAHADITSPISAYAPLSAGQLERSGYAYAALGHIHKPVEPRYFGKTLVAYSGFFAGRGFDELGAGQARFVEIDGERVTQTVIESEAPRFVRLVLDCTGLERTEQVRTLVRDTLREQNDPADTALRLVLQGEVGLGCHIDLAALRLLSEEFSLFEVIDETAPLLDAAALEKAPTLQGAFYRALLPRLQSEDAETRQLAKEAFRMGLAALAGREV